MCSDNQYRQISVISNQINRFNIHRKQIPYYFKIKIMMNNWKNIFCFRNNLKLCFVYYKEVRTLPGWYTYRIITENLWPSLYYEYFIGIVHSYSIRYAPTETISWNPYQTLVCSKRDRRCLFKMNYSLHAFNFL